MRGRVRLIVFFLLAASAAGTAASQDSMYVREHYSKREVMIPVRDGVRLFTAIYAPTDTSRTYPLMLTRTPYGVAPYGPDAYPKSLGPSPLFLRAGFIFVYQDVRGERMSGGNFVNMTPEKEPKRSPSDVDESSDTYDTITWLIRNIPRNNGRAGLWGISYPGFYAEAGMIEAHPALKAVSPQAPIADLFVGDDFHHNGAFFLMDAFNFLSVFGKPRPHPTSLAPEFAQFGANDAYRFFLDMGPLGNADARYLSKRVPFWEDLMSHGTYDKFWKARDILPHVRSITPAVLVVGGLFDAEDLYGPLSLYATLKRKSPHTKTTFVLGPWQHGGWSWTTGASLGAINFGAATSTFYRDSVEFPFFNYYLKSQGEQPHPEALVFETGSNRWRRYAEWPPRGASEMSLYFREHGKLSAEPPGGRGGYDEYVSDPASPVPYTSTMSMYRGPTYVVEDQRFAWRRTDVLSYETGPLENSLTAAGPATADLYVSTTGTDADFVVKIIDVFPDSAGGDKSADRAGRGGTMSADNPVPDGNKSSDRAGPGGDKSAGSAGQGRDRFSVTAGREGYQMMVRGDVMRGKFRNSLSDPLPFVPGEVTRVQFSLRDISHTFLAGHRIMVQVQSSWFPLVDRNPQTFVDIYSAKAGDFKKQTERVHRSRRTPSRIILHFVKGE